MRRRSSLGRAGGSARRSGAWALGLAAVLALGGCLREVATPVSVAPDVLTDVAVQFGTKDVAVVDLGTLGSEDSVPSQDSLDDSAGDAETSPSSDTVLNADAVTPSDAAGGDVAPGCGNGVCAAGENCATCPQDCAACPAVCGDGACSDSETCTTCAKDCGTCGQMCNPLGSAKCPSGEQCFPDPAGNVCAKPGDKIHGAACSEWDDCVFGALCVAGLCRTVCDADGKQAAFACQSGAPCEKLVFDGAGEVGAGLGACKPSDTCDPLTDVGCAAGKACTPVTSYKACTQPGNAGEAAGCNKTACQLGLLCVPGATGAVCRKKCHTGGSNPACTAGTCTALTGTNGQSVPGSIGWCAP